MIRKITNSFLLLFICLPIAVNAAVILPTIPTTQFSIITYGASTGSTDNAPAINAAITAANTAGGGMVVVPAGIFLSGPITMKSNVNLYLSAGAVLQILPYGSGNGLPAGSYPNNGTTGQYSNFISGKSLSNVAVTGTGTIEGNGTAWWAAFNADNTIKRPCLIRLVACNYVLIDSITLQNSPGVHLTIGQSSTMGSNATIRNLTITAPSSSPNTDAIDTWYCNGIDIHNCNLSVGDDNIAMDSYTQNINIKNCTIGAGHGLSVGSYATGVKNVTADSCTFNGTTNGIRLKSERGRGGLDSNFTYTNMTMNNVTYPFYITSYYPTEPYPASADTTAPITSTTPSWNKILFKNFTITNSTYAGIIYGLPEMPVNNIVFNNVQLSATTKGLITNYVTGLVFNCSSITLPTGKGDAIIPYSASISGINITTGASAVCVAPTLVLTSGSTVESVPQGSSTTNVVYTYGGTATGATVIGLPSDITATLNTSAKTLTLSGSPSTVGIYNYTVTTVVPSGDSVILKGEIIVASATAKRVAYVTLPNNAADNLILNKLEANPDFAVTIEDASTVNNYSIYDLVVISPVPPSGSVTFPGLEGLDKPELLLKPFALKNTVWNWGTSVNTAANTITVTNKSHEIFSNLTFTGASNDQLQLFSKVITNGVTGMTSTSWIGSPAVSQLATALGTTTTQSIVEIPIGTNMNGTITARRFLMLGVSESSTAYLTATATQLIENSCYYLLGMSIPVPTAVTTNLKSNEEYKLIQTETDIQVVTENTILGLELYSILGNKVSTSNNKSISTENLAQGVYLVHIIGQNEDGVAKFFKK